MAEFKARFLLDEDQLEEEGQESSIFKASFHSDGTFGASFGAVQEIVHYTLYDETGYNTDGPMTQRATTVAIDEANARMDTIEQDFSGKEDVVNKVPIITDDNTDTQYPSARAVHSALSHKVDVAIDDDETLIFTYR